MLWVRKLSLCLWVMIGLANIAVFAQSATFFPVEKRIPLPPISNSGGFSAFAVDPGGNVYFVNANNQVSKRAVNGTVTTISNGLILPTDIKLDPAGDVYVVDSIVFSGSGPDKLFKITPSGVQTLIATGLGIDADFVDGVNDVTDHFAVDSAGNIYVVDQANNLVFKFNPTTGTRTTIVSGIFPIGVAVDASGNVFVTDDTTSTNGRLLKVSPSGVQTVVASGLSLNFFLASVHLDSSGNIYTVTGSVIKVSPSGAQTSLVSANEVGGVDSAANVYVSIDGVSLDEIQVAVPSTGYVELGSLLEHNSSQVFQEFQPVTFTFDSTVTVGAVNVVTNGALNQDYQSAAGNTCTAKTFSAGQSCTVNVQFQPTQGGLRVGAVVLTNQLGNTVSTVNLHGGGTIPVAVLSPGALTTVMSSGLSNPSAAAVDGIGNTFIVDKGNNRVLELRQGGGTTTIGSGLASPTGVAVDGAGNVFISDTANDRIVKVSPGGQQTTVLDGLNTPDGVAVDGAGNLYVADTNNNRVVKLAVDGVTLTTVGSGFSRPTGLTVDLQGNVFIADFGNNQIVEVTAAGAQSSPVTGLSSGPAGVAVDPAGDIYIAEAQTNQVIEVKPSGSQSVIVGGLSFPFDAVLIAVSGSGELFVADTFNNRVLEVNGASSSLNFGTVKVGSSSAAHTVTLSNNGPPFTPLFFGSVALDANDKNFTFTETCTATGGLRDTPCDITVTFTPKSTGALSGRVTITDAVGTQVISLSGTGN
jgi:sugar lactone lactonase YvrE